MPDPAVVVEGHPNDALAVYVFNSDRVVTGSAGRLGKWLAKLQR